MIITFSIRDFGHPKFLKSQFGHPVMKILAKSLSPTFEHWTEGQKLMQGSTLKVNLWSQASKNSQKQFRASKKRPQLVLQAQ